MSYSYTDQRGDGVTRTFPFGFVGEDKGYIRAADIQVWTSTDGVNYALTSGWTLSGTNQITFLTAPYLGLYIRIRRVVDKVKPFAKFDRSVTLDMVSLNNSFIQMLEAMHEIMDGYYPDTFFFKGNLNMGGNKIINMAPGTSAGDATNWEQLQEQVQRNNVQDNRLGAIEGFLNDNVGTIHDVPYYRVTPEQFGYGLAGQNRSSFEQAGLYAAQRGWCVQLQGKTYDLLTQVPVEMSGATIVGESNTTVNGYFKNPGKMLGFIYGVPVVGQTELKAPRVFQLPPSAVDCKFLVNFASNPDVWGIGMQNDRSVHRDTFVTMRRGNGGDSAPWEHIRSQQIFYGQAFAYQNAVGNTEGGDWTDFSATPIQCNYPSGWGASFAGYNIYIKGRRSIQPDAYIERVCYPDRDGYINVGFLVSSTSAAFSISVDGTEVATSTARISVAGVRIRTYKVYVGFADSVTVRVTHKGVLNQGLTILGFNLHRPRETHVDIIYDKFALYFDGNADYAAGVGAGDYAMSNDALGFFGSYHGGEVALVPPQWRVDGYAIPSFTPERAYSGKTIDLMEKTRIHNIVDTNVYQRFSGNGRHEMSITLRGTNNVPFEVKKLYLGMNGTFDAFTRILYPEYAEGISGLATPDYLCGMTNLVVQENPTTGQVCYTHCNIEEGYPSGKGGVFVKTTDETGSSYQKVYFAWTYDSPIKINKVSCQLVKVFC